MAQMELFQAFLVRQMVQMQCYIQANSSLVLVFGQHTQRQIIRIQLESQMLLVHISLKKFQSLDL